MCNWGTKKEKPLQHAGKRQGKRPHCPLTLTLITGIAIADQPISIYVNGKQVQSDTPAQIVNDRTLVPIRVIAEALDAEVAYNPDNKQVIITTAAPAAEKPNLIRLDNELTTWPYWQDNGHLYLEYRNCAELLRTTYLPPWHSVHINTSGTVNIGNKSVSTYTKQFGEYTAISLNELQRLSIIHYEWDEATQNLTIGKDF